MRAQWYVVRVPDGGEEDFGWKGVVQFNPREVHIKSVKSPSRLIKVRKWFLKKEIQYLYYSIIRLILHYLCTLLFLYIFKNKNLKNIQRRSNDKSRILVSNLSNSPEHPAHPDQIT